ncbi:hypothetical protein [Rhodococcus sp. W8901]|uniref:hypothetical protein n=1 Tax=Rhodococcus sp. W8901 TaxID=2742603 RepID=UPI0015836DBA|nr:hypothetical protein [Rhodococcus sp. W8901]QKT13825.1 hypothetical protein HUN07_26495 [Rhodococcus sp. W8901]
MTDHDDGEPLGPPFSTELLADLHADALTDDVSARLWPLVRQDPDALAVLDSLDAVTARLGEAGRDHSVETPIPQDVAARINSALGLNDSQTPRNVTALSDAPSRRRMITWITVSAASMAAAVAVVFALTSLDGSESAPPTVIATPSSTAAEPAPPSAVDLGTDLDGDQVLALMRESRSTRTETGIGELGNPAVRSACLQAIGIDPARPVVGTREVSYRGSAAVLMLIAGPRPPALTAVVVGSGCDAGAPDLLAQTEIG